MVIVGNAMKCDILKCFNSCRKEMIGVLGHDSALLRLNWAGDNLGEWDEFCYESCPSCKNTIELESINGQNNLKNGSCGGNGKCLAAKINEVQLHFSLI